MFKIFYFLIPLFCLFSCKGNRSQSTVNKNVTAETETEVNASSETVPLLVSGYVSPKDEGVKLYQFNQTTGEMNYISGISGIANPSYVVPTADGRFVYAVSENEGKESAVNALSLNLEEGKLSFLNSQPTHGAAPCYVNLSPQEKFVVTANYMGGSVTVFHRNEEGKVENSKVISFEGHGVNPERQEQPHLHCIGFSPDGKDLLAVDLGTDKIHFFPLMNPGNESTTPFLNEEGMKDLQFPAGCGPRHICFSSDKKYLYLITEISGDVIVMDYKNTASKIIQVIKADTLDAQGSADIHLTPDGKFLYASNRLKGDGVAIFKVDQSTGMLTKTGYQSTGVHPRNFVISPNGKFMLVACRFSNMVEIYEINQHSGILKHLRNVSTTEPSCLRFVVK